MLSQVRNWRTVWETWPFHSQSDLVPALSIRLWMNSSGIVTVFGLEFWGGPGHFRRIQDLLEGRFTSKRDRCLSYLQHAQLQEQTLDFHSIHPRDLANVWIASFHSHLTSAQKMGGSWATIELCPLCREGMKRVCLVQTSLAVATLAVQDKLKWSKPSKSKSTDAMNQCSP